MGAATDFQGHDPASKSSRCRTRANDKAPWMTLASPWARTYHLLSFINGDCPIFFGILWDILGYFGIFWAFRIAIKLGFGTELDISLQAFPTICFSCLTLNACWMNGNQSTIGGWRRHWSLASSGRVGLWNAFQWPVPPVAHWMWGAQCWDTEMLGLVRYPLVNKRSYGKWPFRVDFSIKNCDFPQLC